jgi:hypothetical protein
MLHLYELADRSKVESVKLAVKVKLSFPVYSTKAWGRNRGILHSFLTSALNGVVNRTPRPLFLRERTPEAGWAPENI